MKENDIEAIKFYYPSDDVEHLTALSNELAGEDPEVKKQIEKLTTLGIGRSILKVDRSKPLEKQVFGISLPLGDEHDLYIRHALGFTNGAILIVEPLNTDKENVRGHKSFFAARKIPLELEGWESAGELSRKIRQQPDLFYSKVTHSIFNPEQRLETQDLFEQALENGFELRENEIDGIRQGSDFLNKKIGEIFDAKKHRRRQ